jgi:hypothetical protein
LGVVTLFDLSGNEIPLEDGGLLLEEFRSYNLVVTGSDSAKAWLDVLPLNPQAQGQFRIDIGHWVGETNLKIDTEGEFYEIPIFVQPRAEKLSESRWFVMLREIETWLPGATLGAEGGLLGRVGISGIASPLLAEALVPVLPVLEKALKTLINQPRQLDKGIWIEQSLTKIRGGCREMIAWISQNPEIGMWLDPWKAVELDGHGPKIPLRRSIDSVDHPANQYVAWLLFQIIKKLEEVQNFLNKIANSRLGSDETSVWCEARALRIDASVTRLKRLVKNSFLSRIDRRPASDSALLTVLDDPVYARIHSMGRLFLSPLFNFEKSEDAIRAAVKPSFTIYEFWCYLALFNLLKTHLHGWVWNNKDLGKLLSLTGTGTGALFSASSPSGDMVLELLFNPVFVSYHAHKNQARWSLSGERRPDFLISLKKNGTEGTWIFLDAKYRVGRSNIENAFQTIHIYRDSLRYDGYQGKCRAGFLLSPSMTTDAKKWFSDEFKNEHLAGVWELKPGKEYGPEMAEWIMALLNSSLDRKS